MSIVSGFFSSCEKDFQNLRFAVAPTDDFKSNWIDNCIKEKRKQGDIGLVKPIIPKPAIRHPKFIKEQLVNDWIEREKNLRPRPIEIPKTQPTTAQELPAKKDGKIDNNTLIILGFALVIIILLNRK